MVITRNFFNSAIIPIFGVFLFIRLHYAFQRGLTMPKSKSSDARASSAGTNSDNTSSVSVSAAAASEPDRSSGSITGADLRYAIKCIQNNFNAISVCLETENLKSGEKERKAQLIKLRNALKLFVSPLVLHWIVSQHTRSVPRAFYLRLVKMS